MVVIYFVVNETLPKQTKKNQFSLNALKCVCVCVCARALALPKSSIRNTRLTSSRSRVVCRYGKRS